MLIGKKDLFWNYAATFFKLGSSILIFPLILNILPSETVAIWNLFIIISTITSLIDFGFNTSFTRNITYIFSGTNKLLKNGYQKNEGQAEINYELLKDTIKAMKWIYIRLAFLMFLSLSIFGTWYIKVVLKSYTGDKTEIYISWIISCLLNTYTLYTMYYESLIQGKGLVKKSKQIIIYSQLGYLILASSLLVAGFGLIALVGSQLIGIIITRVLSYKAFYSKELKYKLANCYSKNHKKVLEVIYPNSIKVGFTILGKFLIQRATFLIGSFYLTLTEIANYGISNQILIVLSSFSLIYYSTNVVKIAHLRIKNDLNKIKEIYLKSLIMLIITFILGGLIVILFGEITLKTIKSKTSLLHHLPLFILLISNFEQALRTLSSGVILTKNEVPFYKSYLISGIMSVIAIIVLFEYLSTNIYILLLTPLTVNLLYQSWKWPMLVAKEHNIKLSDFQILLNRKL
jgi:O-antigen/teichoic acid export membrane protein